MDMIIKRISAIALSAAMIFTSMPIPSFAANNLNLNDRDTSLNRVSKYEANGALLGIDVEVLGVNDEGSNSYAYDSTRNPYQSDNGPLKIVVENGDKSIVEVSYNGNLIERISDQKQLLLYVNEDDRVVVKAIDKPGSDQYDSWEFEYGNTTKYYRDASVAVDLSDEFMGGYDKVTLSPRSGNTDNSDYNDPNHVNYTLVDDYNGAFGIDRHTGVVYVKDNSVLMNSSNSSTEREFSFNALRDTQINNNFIKLTKNKRSQRGGAFSTETIDLTNDFDLSYDALFGHRSKGHSGADGMAFVLTTTEPTTTGWNGGGLGYKSNSEFNNSVAIEFDTWHNGESWASDPYSSSNGSNHIAFMRNASVDHDSALTFRRPNGSNVTSHSINLETNSYRDVRITWDASEQELGLYMDGSLIGTLDRNIVSSDLNNNPNVYFGWVASTGSYGNNHRIDNVEMTVESSPRIVVEASYGNDTGQITIPIEITDTRETLDARRSTASLEEDQVKILYASDHKGKVYKIDPAAKITEKIADSGIAWFDIANDKYTTLYGVKGDGRLYSDIDESISYVTDLSKPDKNINSLAVDEAGNFYYIRDAVLKFYNEETGNITDIMNTTYQSLGDLVFHGDKMYYAAYRGNSYGSDPILVELDIEDKTTRVVGAIPSATYGMASVNGDLLILFSKQIDKIDPQTGARTEIMQIGAGANSIYGSAQGEVMVQDNVLLNDGGDSTKYVSNVKGQSISQDDTNYTKVYGDYGVLLIKPDGSYIYILNGKLDILLDLNDGESLTETFDYSSRYTDNSQSDSSQLVITINGSNDEEAGYETKKGLHLDAFDLNGDTVVDASVTDGQSVSVWHDSAGVDNEASAVNGAPKLVVDGINGKRAVDFGDYSGGMNIASHEEINNDKFIKKTIATVFETGDSVSGIQYIFEEGGNVRGYNFAIAPDSNGVASLYAMVYNKVEWQTDQLRSIKLTAVEPNTVYAAYMVHNALTGTYQAYVNGDFVELTSSETLTEVEMQFVHPNPAGLGWINDDTIYPHNFVVDENGGGPFDGMIGELISWNDALTFQEVQDVNGQLKRKWKQAEAVSDVVTKQTNDTLQITWATAEGASSYEVYLSTDGVIDNNDVKYTTASTLINETLPSSIKAMDSVQVLVRYITDGGFSKMAEATHNVLKKPENFEYTNLGEKYLFRFSKEEGRSYILKYGDNSEVVISSANYLYLPTSIELDSVELYEVAVEGSTPSMQAGHSVKADGPTEVELGKVENLQGNLVGSNINLTWDQYSNASEYKVFAGNDEDSMTEVGVVTTNAYTFNADASVQANKVGFKYFKVRAITSDEFMFSLDSDTVAVSTPYLAQIKADLEALINTSRTLHDNSHEGLGNDELIENDLYDVDEYEEGSKAVFNTAITDALDKLNNSNNDLEIVAALDSLKSANDEFNSRQVIPDNAITLTFKDTADNVIKAPVTYYGPMPEGNSNYSFDLDITIDGFTRLVGNEITLVFESETQTINLVYSPNLSTAIDEAQAMIDANYELGPNDDGFYSVGQYDQSAYDAFVSYFNNTAKPALTNGASGQVRDDIARELKELMDELEATHVTSNNKMTFMFVDGSDQAINMGGISQIEKYAPSGFEKSYTPPSNNYYRPVVSPVTVTFGDSPVSTNVEYTITDLYTFVLQAESKHTSAVEGSNTDGYQVGQFEEGSKAILQAAIDTAKAVLNGSLASDTVLSDAATALSIAINTFDDTVITADNRIEVVSVSGETGETLLVTTHYGPNGNNRTVDIADITYYKPYVDPDKTSDGTYNTLDITFTGSVQTVKVMYREDEANKVPSSDKSNWRATAEANIISYAANDSIPWRTNSRYDIADTASGETDSDGKEYSDFLNILGNALKAGDEKYADPDFVDEYINEIETNEPDEAVVTDYDSLIDMLKKHFKDISDAFYGTGSSNEKLESSKSVFYEDDIDTSVAFKIKSTGVSDPEFHFDLRGNKYLSYHYPTIKLYKLSDPNDELENDPSLLDGASVVASDTFVETVINPDATGDEMAYGYKIVVKPKDVSNFESGDVYFAKVITRVIVNSESTFYAAETSTATTESAKHAAAVQKLVDMYEAGSEDHYYLHGVLKDSEGNPKKVTDISAGDLQFALGVIYDGATRIVEGLKIVTESKWLVDGIEDGTGEREEGLNFNIQSRPTLPEMF